MENLFFIVVGMSLTGSFVILFVLLARLVLRKAPKIFSYALWAVVLFRLLCPFTRDSEFSLLPSKQMVYADGRGGGTDQVIQIQTGIPAVDRPVNDFLVDHPYQAGQPVVIGGDPEENLAPIINQLGPVPDWRTVPAVIWLAGFAVLMSYSLISLLRLRWKLVGAVPLEGEKNVRLADHIPSPFVLGVFRPRIYLTSGLPEGERDYILLHERTHIRRGDHILRALAWLALAVHWFNPLVWLAFHLAGKDMEMSCDEAVLCKMGRDVRADYSTSLLRLSQGGKLPAGPLAFGGGDPASRIRNVLSYKKPAVWVVALALAAVACTGVALATDQKRPLIDPDSVTTVTRFNATRNTTTPQHTGVYTPENRWEDLNVPQDAAVVSADAAAELVRLINSFNKTVYAQGDFTLNGWEHHFYRLDCTDGGFYLVDYWYWNGFSFNPLHMGEDDYTTLVTYYSAEGRSETTWQMEYSFDRAFSNWQFSVWKYKGENAPQEGKSPVVS